MKESSKQFGCYLFILKIFSPTSWLENKQYITGLEVLLKPLERKKRVWRSLCKPDRSPGLDTKAMLGQARALLGAFCILTELALLSLYIPCWDCPLLYTIQILDLLLNLRAKKAHQIEHLIKTQDLFVCVIIQCVKINASVFNK